MTERGGTELEVAGTAMPSPRSIAAELKRQLNEAVLAERERRGTVVLAEDSWPMQRSLAAVVETCGEYRRAFATAEKEAKQVAEEELVGIVGESDGIPNQGMTVPDPEGDVVISRDISREHTFDPDALFTAVAYEVIESMRPEVEGVLDPHLDGDEAEATLAGLLTLAMGRLCELGKFSPQVTKVKPFTDALGRMGGADKIVSTVTSTHKIRSDYRGVKVERKDIKITPKGRKS
jgi:hypothetical protein